LIRCRVRRVNHTTDIEAEVLQNLAVLPEFGTDVAEYIQDGFRVCRLRGR